MRTPMPWRHSPGGGFTAPDTRPWLPLGPTETCNVEGQRSDPGSMLHLARDLMALRRRTPELQTGGYESMAAPEGVWAWRRGDRIMVTLNMSDHDSTLEGTGGRLCISTDRARDGEYFDGALRLRGWEGAVAEIR